MLIEFRNCFEVIQLVHNVTIDGVLHVGAHVGEEIVDYAELGVSHVTWIEANPVLIPTLEQNLARYSINQKLINCALWDRDEQINLHVTNNLQSSSAFELGTHKDWYPEIKRTGSLPVPAYRADTLARLNLIELPKIQFVNIDTQGAELAALKGFGDHLVNGGILGIYLEVNREPLYKGIPLVDEIDDFLGDSEFSRVWTTWTEAGWGDAFYLKRRTEFV